MAKVIGVGGVFFKSKDTAALNKWYSDVLGMPLMDWGGILLLPQDMAAHPGAATVFSPFKQETDYFQPSTKDFMINLAVDDLDGILAKCAEHGVTPVKTFPEEANGKFAHIMDPEGNKLELWEPKPMG
jgi:predicted enzyme related to lactoylglutathione lyase